MKFLDRFTYEWVDPSGLFLCRFYSISVDLCKIKEISSQISFMEEKV